MKKHALPVLLSDAGSVAYSIIAVLGSAVFLHRKWRLYKFRQIDGEFDPARWSIRFKDVTDSLATQPKSENENPSGQIGPRIVFVTFGWGEVASIEPLIRALKQERPTIQLVFTVKHQEAIRAASRLTDTTIYPLPFDNLIPIATWHETARPDMVVMYQRFRLSLFLRSLWLFKIPFLIVDARLGRVAKRERPNVITRWQLRGLKHICLASDKDLKPLRGLLSSDATAHVTGSIKFPHARPAIEPERLEKLRSWIEKASANAPLLVAGSTHHIEEDFLLDAFELVRQQLPQDVRPPVLLLAPRKPERADEVAAIIEGRQLRLSRRSRSETEKNETPCDVLLLDTLGELACAYQFGVGAFVGGTIAADAHNITEPLIWEIPVAYGPKRGNFGVEQQICEEAGVGFRVHTSEELAAHWLKLLTAPTFREEVRSRAQTVIQEQSGSFGRVLSLLVQEVDAVSASKSR